MKDFFKACLFCYVVIQLCCFLIGFTDSSNPGLESIQKKRWKYVLPLIVPGMRFAQYLGEEIEP